MSFWGMPLMFVIAGFSIWHSLDQRRPLAFVQERTQRLLVPLLMGLVLLAPPQVYYQLRGNESYAEPFTQILSRFFDVELTFDFPWFVAASPPTGLFHVAHLWFIYDLFLYTLLLLPLFLFLRTESGLVPIRRLASFLSRQWNLLYMGLPIAAIEAALGTDMSGGWNQVAYLIFLLLGFLLAADKRLWESACRLRKIGFALAVLGSAVGLAGGMHYAESAGANILVDYDPVSVMLRLLKGMIGWCWLVAILGLLEANRRSGESRFEERELSRKRILWRAAEAYRYCPSRYFTKPSS